jgi:predicted nucleic acid-binding protein
MVDISLDKLDKILEQLKGIRIKEAVDLRKRLQKEKAKVKTSRKIIKETIKVSANQKRSSKLSRYWRYVKLIRDNFPDVTTSQIRTQLKQRKKGQKTKIPDAVWQNPSG